jgi:omega-amidase
MELNCYLVQFDIDWKSITGNLNKLDNLFKEGIKENSLILLPELFNCGYSHNLKDFAESPDGTTSRWMKNKAKSLNSVVAGSLLIKENNRFYNRFLWYFPDGKAQYYDKHHLFCIDGEESFMTRGNERVIIEYLGVRFLPVLCYDIRFPVWSRNKNDYDVLVYSANWPTNRKNVWNTLLGARAMENQSYVIGINKIGLDGFGTLNCGCSQVIDFFGNTVARSGEDTEEVLNAILDISILEDYRKKFPAWQDADLFDLKQ